MFNTKGTSLRTLVRRLIFFMALALLGSWGLLFPRLDITPDLAFFEDSHNLFYYDLGCSSLVFLGLLLSIYYRARLKPRLRRADFLGESNW